MYELAEVITKQTSLCQAIGRLETLRSRQPSARWSREKTDTSDAVSQTENVCSLQTLLLNAGGIEELQEEQRKRHCLKFVQKRFSWKLFGSLLLNRPERLGT
jgi:hypothetical protein